jgi:hypothetical protein
MRYVTIAAVAAAAPLLAACQGGCLGVAPGAVTPPAQPQYQTPAPATQPYVQQPYPGYQAQPTTPVSPPTQKMYPKPY